MKNAKRVYPAMRNDLVTIESVDSEITDISRFFDDQSKIRTIFSFVRETVLLAGKGKFNWNIARKI
jgi:hypothetical protein